MTKAVRTDALLIQAASAEFREHGFAGTDTNKIARRAGFAPQTFYRWFKDKTAIFLAVYRVWEEAIYRALEEDEGRAALRDPERRGADAASLVDAIVAHHRAHRLFRRSLRALSLEVDSVRRARAESRMRQAERVARAAAEGGALTREDIIVRLLQIERLADALAENELADLALPETAARARLAELLNELRGG